MVSQMKMAKSFLDPTWIDQIQEFLRHFLHETEDSTRIDDQREGLTKLKPKKIWCHSILLHIAMSFSLSSVMTIGSFFEQSR